MIKLEYFTNEDFAQLISWISSEELKINWSGPLFSYPLTEKDLEWYLEDTNDMGDSDALVYKAVDPELGEVIGHISLGSINRRNGSGRISRVLIGNTSYRGKGYCKDMIHQVLKIGFEELKLHRISLGVYEQNTAAIKCYQKAGLRIDGIMRDMKKVRNSYWSLVEMSILEQEWRDLLAADNIKSFLH